MISLHTHLTFICVENLYKIAVVQHPPVYLNLSQSVEKAVELIKESAEGKARMVVFPETWLPGYPVWLDYAPNAGVWDHPGAKQLFRLLHENSLEIDSSLFHQLQNAAIENDCLVVMGANERVGRTIYNTIFYFHPSCEHVLHRKLMPTYTERLVWGMGDGSTLSPVKHDGHTITGLICWEHWMPLARAATRAQGEDIHIAQWPMVKDLHQIASQQYAFEGQCYVIAAGCTLTKAQMINGIKSHSKEYAEALEMIHSIPLLEQDYVLKGGSSVIKPNTEYLVSPVKEKETIIYTELNLSILSEGNLFIDTNGHYARPDVFKLTVNRNPQQNISYNDDIEG
ncbi:carbon-nitrogen hydrolase family protein [Balneola vulgaris]|uniref:carbon-nitrogen hydrolase family protein n=1 Tax=Balneola vulgaris TaxID=287535 RepID=UPI00035F793A|nr:carbon-nitrogen hydrolase family protein [Balneola vulgaris]